MEFSKSKKQFLRYLITGFSAFAAEYILYLFLYKILHMDYALASAIVYSLLFFITFVITRKWTFESRGNPTRQLVLHGSLFLFNLLFGSYFLMKIFVGAGVPPEIAPFLRTAAITIWNFLAYKFIIYRE